VTQSAAPSTTADIARDAAVVAPRGFRSLTANIGIKDGVDECSVLWSDRPARAVGLFTKSLFAGPSVVVSREVAATGSGRGVVTVSGNANVATGDAGLRHARDLQAAAARAAGIDADEVFVSSTGVIGRPYPPAVWGHLDHLPAATDPADLLAVARAIMTTDTRPKCVGTTVPGTDARIAGVAKGVGMIEPDMATLLTYFVTDAEVSADELDAIFRRVIDRTFNAVTVDGDTSTSDSALLIANGAAGPVDLGAFERTLYDLALALTRDVASDGEGATKLLVVRVTGASSEAEARLCAKAIANSPLVKTAVHGADPNWGRLAMAVGKLYGQISIDPSRVRFFFGDQELSGASTPADLAAAEAHMRLDEVTIRVDLGAGDEEFTVYGCDLTHGYISINADYTT
jgi:glutamate N-acetyltransferase/amino-acid N-acetyltransferase